MKVAATSLWLGKWQQASSGMEGLSGLGETPMACKIFVAKEYFSQLTGDLLVRPRSPFCSLVCFRGTMTPSWL